MPQCVACDAELEPPVRAPHTVYVKSLYRVGGQDYCRHHIIRAAVAAGVITEFRAGAGPAPALPRVRLPPSTTRFASVDHSGVKTSETGPSPSTSAGGWSGNRATPSSLSCPAAWETIGPVHFWPGVVLVTTTPVRTVHAE